MVKDANFYSGTRKSETNIINLSIIRSIIIEIINENVKNMPKFMQSSRTKANSKRKYMYGDKYTICTFKYINEMIQETNNISEDESDYYFK